MYFCTHIMFWPLFHPALIFLMSEKAFAESNLFSDSDGFLAYLPLVPDGGDVIPGADSSADKNLFSNSDGLLAPLHPIPDGGAIVPGAESSVDPNLSSNPDETTASLLSSGNENLFANSDSLWNDEPLSSCPDDGSNSRPSRFRARDNVCLPPITKPMLPGLDEIEDAVLRTERTRPDPPYFVTIQVNMRSITAAEPEFFCQYGTRQLGVPSPLGLPVCAKRSQRQVSSTVRSNNPTDSRGYTESFKYTLKPSTLRRFIYLVANNRSDNSTH